ncbi:MAG: KTSC domain-containing protein [Pseudomonadota bacterium]
MRWILAKSEFIRAYSYDPRQQILRVRFKNGRVYDYRDIGSRLFAEFVNSDSQGAFLNQHIKPDREYKMVA